MPTLTEDEFADVVEDKLVELFDEDNVEREHYLDESSRFVDFWVNLDIISLAIETENSFEGLFEGVGQVLMYSGHNDTALPVVVIPSSIDLEEPEASMLNHHVGIVQIDTEDK